MSKTRGQRAIRGRAAAPVILVVAGVVVAGLASLAAQRSKPASRRAGPDFDAHVSKLRERLARLPRGRDFHLVVERPFVVLGDESMAAVRRRAHRTVEWAVGLLEKGFFDKRPNHVIDIWLFKDKRSYREHAKRIFGDEPDTPFGYYSPRHRALILNIATGGGTLVHEIVHPYVRADFPACPAWLNEGLGSLFEQCNERDGRIVGLTNWRLAGLQKAIRARRVPTFATLCATSDRDFYGSDRGTNYAQARYLCYYLQEKGLLRRFYKEFRARHRDDPSGYESLRRVLAKLDMKAFQNEWETFVLGLRYR